MKTEACNIISVPYSKVAMHKDSCIISKLKPKIRIIHIFAPKIIQTDPANFRELVQRLTGKPKRSNPVHKTSVLVESGKDRCRQALSSNLLEKVLSRLEPAMQCLGEKALLIAPKHIPNHTCHCEPSKIMKLQNGERVEKEDKEIYGSENFNGVWNGFADVAGLIQDLAEFPLLPYKSSSQMEIFGGMPLC